MSGKRINSALCFFFAFLYFLSFSLLLFARYRFEIQIQKDQDACTKPDTNTPFGSKQDAIKRLIRYHCMYEEKCEENEEEELQFETTAEWFPDAFRTMLSRYQRLMINESMVRSLERSTLAELCFLPFFCTLFLFYIFLS